MRRLLLIFLLGTWTCGGQPSLTGTWETPTQPPLRLRELPQGLEVNGHQYSLEHPETGRHPGGQEPYIIRLSRTARGYRRVTETRQAWLEGGEGSRRRPDDPTSRVGVTGDRYIATGLLIEEVDYALTPDDVLVETIRTRSTRKEVRWQVVHRYQRK